MLGDAAEREPLATTIARLALLANCLVLSDFADLVLPEAKPTGPDMVALPLMHHEAVEAELLAATIARCLPPAL